MHAWELGGSPSQRICDPAVVHCLHVTVDAEEQGFVDGGDDLRHGDVCPTVVWCGHFDQG